MTALLWPCFFLSGAAALALEMLWMRSAGLVCGQTAATTATVLACYFGGLGWGGALGRRARGWGSARIYGLLEVGVATGALWSVLAFRVAGQDRVIGWLAGGGPASRAAFVALATLPATVCLGATLPVLGAALVDPRRLGVHGGALYALNTAGGALGTALAGFGLPGWIGVTASYAVAAAASVLAGLTALLVARRLPCAHLSEPKPRPISTAASMELPARSLLTAAAFGVGALGLGLEVTWARLFAQVLHNSVYSFTAVTLVFILGSAAGSFTAAALLRRIRPLTVAAGAAVVASITTAAGVWVLVRLTDGLSYFGMRSGLAEYVSRIVGLAAITAGPAAFASGVAFPAIWSAWGAGFGAARPLGTASAANAVGGIAGALGAGFLAIPHIGLRGTALVASLGYAVLGECLAAFGSWLRPVGYAAILAAALLDPTRAPIVHLRAGSETLRELIEGPSGIVTVVDDDGDRQLRLDNYYLLGGSFAAVPERRLGLLPLVLHPAPGNVAFVGLATGITASAAVALGIGRTTVFELVPEVAVAARREFGPWNAELLTRPGVTLVAGDGRAGIAASADRFDVIVSDLFVPWHAGATSLYSREMYQTAARKLASAGIFCQWLPLYQLTRGEFSLVARTFLSVFPHTSLWRSDFYPDRPVVALVGQSGERRVDLDAAAARIAALPDWARDPLLAEPAGLAMLYASDLASAGDLVPPGLLNTDEHPRIEFEAPRLTRVGRDGDKDWFTGAELADFVDDLARHTESEPDPVLELTPAVAAARRAGRALSRYAIAARAGDAAAAAKLEAEVRLLVPEVVMAAEESTAAPTLAQASRALAGLQVEQAAARQRLDEMERALQALSTKPGPAR